MSGLRTAFGRISRALRSLAARRVRDLPELPRFKPRGITVNRGDSFEIRDLSIALKDANDVTGESFVVPMSVPEWAAGYAAGATFSLRRRLDPAWFNVDGSRVQIGKDGRSLDVALKSPVTDVFAKSYEIAEKTLDLLAAEAYRVSSLADPLREHSVWWRSDSRTSLRCVSTARLAAEMRSVAVVKDPLGNVRPPPERAPLGWHASHAYFRRSQLTDSLDESYRYLYLALEAVLSSIHPWRPRMSETQWLKAALKRATEGYGIDLSQFNAKPGGNAHRRFMNEQYRARRCALFHAKLDREPIVPGDVPTRADLADATRRLGRLYVRLAAQITGLGFAGGSMTYIAFEQMVKALGNSRLYVSPVADFELDRAVTAPARLSLRAGGVPAIHHITAAWKAPTLPPDLLRRAGALMTKDGETFEGIAMQAHIDPSGVDELQICLQVEFANSQNLREWFL